MRSEDNWDIIIEPKTKLFNLNVKELSRYKDLLIMFIKKDIITVYKQTVLGPIWFFIQPIMTTITYVFIFGNLAGISTDGIPKPLFYISGILMWNYFADCFMQTADTFAKNQNIFGKVYFPRLIVPLSKITSGIIKMLIQFLLFAGIYCYYLATSDVLSPSWSILLFPLIVIILAGLGLGFGLIFSSLTKKYRDFKFLMTFGIQLFMYASPVIYPLSSVDGSLKQVIMFNPITHLIEGFKYAFLGNGELTLWGMLYSFGFMLVILFFGITIFNKTEKDFIDTI